MKCRMRWMWEYTTITEINGKPIKTSHISDEQPPVEIVAIDDASKKPMLHRRRVQYCK